MVDQNKSYMQIPKGAITINNLNLNCWYLSIETWFEVVNLHMYMMFKFIYF
jgi:hypothetical protein